MKKLSLIILLLSLFGIVSHNVFCQNLSIYDLEALLKKSDWNQVNSYLINKQWEYYDSSEETDNDLGTITWLFNKDYYSDKAEAWFYLYLFEGKPEAIQLVFFNSDKYNKLLNSLPGRSYVQQTSEIDNSVTNTTYSSYSYLLSLELTKRESESYSYSSKSTTQYSFTIVNKGSQFDPDNGVKIEYWYGGNIPQYKYTLLNSKLHGEYIQYYPTGDIKMVTNYSHGKQNGLVKEYTLEGALSSEFNVKDDSLHGALKTYNEHGILSEVNYNNGILVGNAKITSYYPDGSIYCVETGQYVNNERSGKWKCRYPNILDTTFNCFVNYTNGKLHGEVYDFLSNDTLTIANYQDGQLHGDCHVKIITAIFLGDPGNRFPVYGLVDHSIGKYHFGKKDGYWYEYSNGSLNAEGLYDKNKKQGLWKYYLPSGNALAKATMGDATSMNLEYDGELMYEAQYKDGLQHGPATRYFYHIFNEETYTFDITPTYCTENYVNDVKNGPFYENFNNGKTIKKGTHKNGKRDGVWTEENNDANGNRVYITANYKNDKLNGEFTLLNHKKIKVHQSNYNNDVLVGDVKHFNDSTGVLEVIYNLNQLGETQQISLFYPSGNKAGLIIYENGYTKEMYNYADNSNQKTLKQLRVISRYQNKYTVELETFSKSRNTLYTYSFVTQEPLSLDDPEMKGTKNGTYRYSDSIKTINGQYKNDKKIGEWTTLYKKQDIIISNGYENNKIVSENFYENHTNEPYSGTFTRLKENSQTEEIKIKNGMRNGSTKIFNSNGELILKQKYKEGILIE